MTKRRKGREVGIVAALLVLAAVLYTLFAAPKVSVTSDGTYINAMEALHLTWMGEPVPSGKVVQQFAYMRYDFASLLTIGQPSVVYPAALVRAVTQPFGLPFDTQALACAYGLMIALGTYLAVSGLYPRSRAAAVMTPVVLACVLMHNALTGYLNSLYGTGTAIACLVLFIGCVISALCSDRGSGAWQIIKVLVSGVLLVQSQPQMMVMIPAVLLCTGLTVWHAWPVQKGSLPLFCLLCTAALAVSVGSMVVYIGNEKDIQSDAANQLAVFQGYLTVAEQPEEVLDSLGLDASYAADIGRSYYEDESLFVHYPKEDERLLTAIRLPNRMLYCVQHPDLVMRMVEDKYDHFYDALNDRMRYDGWQGNYVRLSPYPLLKLVAGEGGFAPTTWRMLGAALVLLALAAASSKGLRKLCAALASFCLCGALYLPVSMILTGGLDVSMAKVIFFFLGWLSLLIGICALILLGERVFIFLASHTAPLALPWRDEVPDRIPCAWVDRIHMGRAALCWMCAVLAMIICCGVMLPAQHVGGVNNGDYGRMMEQIDLYWTQELLDNSSMQSGEEVVEEYTFREPFHPERLTSLDPTYSLIYPSMVVRIWSLLTSSPYSTLVQAWVLLALTLCGILLIVYDLYPVLGRMTIPLGLTLVIMLFGENYVAWYNSLFGESTICTSLILMIACAIHLCVKPQGGRRRLIWLILLAVSVRMLTCSKAQLLLGLPSGLTLLVALGIYHRPQSKEPVVIAKKTIPAWTRLVCYGLMMLMLCGYVTLDSVGIYRKNDDVSSKQTVWQSVFYGALMIADDVDAAMADLGLEPALKADIGKHAYYAESDYVYPVLSEEAQAAIYDKINAVTMVGYYLRHPKDLMLMLDHAAQESCNLHTGFMTYTGENYAASEGLYRFNIWRYIRPLTACHAFWQYVLLYGAAVIWCIRLMLRRDRPAYQKLFALLFICVMLIGTFQYPLTVIGNGFADNNKQLFTFMLCHDLMVVTAAAVILRSLLRRALRPCEPVADERKDA